MKGYIIKDVTCKNNLTKNLFWYDHEKSEGEEPYVFSKDGVDYVREISEMWTIKPAYLVKAEWTPEGGVKVLGNLETFWN